MFQLVHRAEGAACDKDRSNALGLQALEGCGGIEHLDAYHVLKGVLLWRLSPSPLFLVLVLLPLSSSTLAAGLLALHSHLLDIELALCLLLGYQPHLLYHIEPFFQLQTQPPLPATTALIRFASLPDEGQLRYDALEISPDLSQLLGPKQGLPSLAILRIPLKYDGNEHIRLKYCDLLVEPYFECLAPVLVDQELPELLLEIP